MSGYRRLVAIREIERLGGIVGSVPTVPQRLGELVGSGRRRMFDDVRTLHFFKGEASDATLSQIGTLTSIKELVLSGAAVTDPGLAHLKGLTELEKLWLDNNTRLTDAGLVHLNGLTNLKMLSLRNTRVTVAGVAELRRALPQLRIRR